MPENASSIVVAAIDELEVAARFTQSAEELIFRYPKEALRFDGIDAAASKVRDEARGFKNNYDSQAVLRGLLVQACAAFELYIRKAIESVLEYHESKGDPIPEAVGKNNLYFTGRGFCLVHDGVGDRKLNFDEMALNISTCYSESEQTKLNKSAFTSFLGQCTHYSVEKAFKKIDIKDIWVDVARQTDIQKALGAKAQKETAKLIEERMKEYLKIRNGIAHGEEGFETVTFDKLMDVISFYRSLIASIEKVITKNFAN